MFRDQITATPFTGDIPDSVLGRISGDYYQSDVSFLSTLRALVYPRMPEEDTLKLFIRTYSLTRQEIATNTATAIFRHIMSTNIASTFQPHTIRLCVANNNSPENNTACLDYIDKELLKFTDNRLVKVEKFTEFFRNFFRCSCYIDPAAQTTLLFTEPLTLKNFHFLQIAVPVMLPWYFPAESGITQQERTLIESFKEPTPTSYLAALAAAAEKYDFRGMFIKSELGNFETRFLEKEAQDVERDIARCMDAINDHQDSIVSLTRKQYDLNIRLLGVHAKIAEGDSTSEIVSYFLHNRNLALVRTDDDAIVFDCKGYLTYFDEEIARRFISSGNSIFYRAGTGVSKPDMELFMRALFLDQSIRLKFCARYTFHLTGNVRGEGGVRFGPEFADCLPNPHINAYRCLGSHQAEINTLLKSHNYVAAVEQCVCSCMSLNLADGIVIGEFMRYLFGRADSSINTRCIELPDGSVVTAKKAIAWLKEQNEKKETQPPKEEAHE